MTSFSFDIDYDAPPEVVFDAFWSLEDWPAVAKHVTGIEMAYEDDTVQVLFMHVQTASRRDAFKTVRIRQGHSIFYFQPSPPPALRRHSGWWHVEAVGTASRVVSEHSFDLEPAAARHFLASVDRPVDSDDALVDGVRDVLHHNSRQTMLALRERLAAGQVAPKETHHAIA